jgi:hypothetical protein
MAVSDYVQIVYDNDGNTIPTCSVACGDISFDAYKNWLYVSSKKYWNKDSGFTEPTIGQISGSNNFTLFGIQVATQELLGLVNNQGIPYSTLQFFHLRYMDKSYAGICSYGYLNYIGKIAKDNNVPDNYLINSVSQHDKKGVSRWIECRAPFPDDQEWNSLPEEEKDKVRNEFILIPLPEDYDSFDSYCGITQDMIDALVKWLQGIDSDLAIKIKDNKKAEYSNQGNRYFADHGIIEPTTSPVSEKGTVFLHEILKYEKDLTPEIVKGEESK